ncbi:SGNH/GDSL hydrolase family protein [Pseudolysobacter antarcticus]|uniref:SGNH/GDSL hydrolase family protein n=1 Tax=Pseudolysobacter antarcticus TaxID=2511995 RepID=A0A411HPU4_9GAMM|nr:SGNH/GDSL hydrolase family protein [Pseudolysobacter antarcticus]QBB72518.1 SGNH/GDSL hydrolase family protein [Pseudolysobacter antarcticus]
MLGATTGSDKAAPDASPRFLALGDSYTIGEGVAETDRWPMQLAAKLRTQGILIESPQIIAKTGWTTDELSSAMDGATLHPPYALVTLLIGVNNQYRGRDTGNYRVEFSALLQRAIHLAGDLPQHVIVVSIPDWGVTAFGQKSGRDTQQIARELDAYNAINRDVSTAQHVRYVDIANVSRAGGARAEMLTEDGLHPSAAMYAQWAAQVLPEARAALSSH